MSDKFYISTDKEKLDLFLIHQFLSKESYWAQGRSLDDVEKSIKHSMCFGLYNSNNEQIGFARIVSDYTIFAWILDVFILKEYRNKGLAKKLITSIIDHPELQNLNRWGLMTKDAHNLYNLFGFTPIQQPEMFMEIVNKKWNEK